MQSGDERDAFCTQNKQVKLGSENLKLHIDPESTARNQVFRREYSKTLIVDQFSRLDSQFYFCIIYHPPPSRFFLPWSLGAVNGVARSPKHTRKFSMHRRASSSQ